MNFQDNLVPERIPVERDLIQDATGDTLNVSHMRRTAPSTEMAATIPLDSHETGGDIVINELPDSLNEANGTNDEAAGHSPAAVGERDSLPGPFPQEATRAAEQDVSLPHSIVDGHNTTQNIEGVGPSLPLNRGLNPTFDPFDDVDFGDDEQASQVEIPHAVLEIADIEAPSHFAENSDVPPEPAGEPPKLSHVQRQRLIHPYQEGKVAKKSGNDTDESV